MSKLGDVLSKLVQFKRITDEVWGVKSPAAGQFFAFFFEKTFILMPLNHISHVFRTF